MTEEELEKEGREFQPRFFARLAQLAAPYSTILFLIQKPAFCAPRPRLCAVLTTGQGLDLRFAQGTFRLLNLNSLGLPRAVKKLLAPSAPYILPPSIYNQAQPEAAAEACWEHVFAIAQPQLTGSDNLPTLPVEGARSAEWLEQRAAEIETPPRPLRSKKGQIRIPITKQKPGGTDG